MRSRTTEITLEIDQVTTLAGSTHPVVLRCVACARDVAMVAPEAAALMSGTSVRAVYRQAEAGQIHCREDASDRLLVCVDSVLDWAVGRRVADREAQLVSTRQTAPAPARGRR